MPRPPAPRGVVRSESRLCPLGFELREVANGTGGNDLVFTGFACVTAAEYEMEDWLGPWTESVTPGAFKKTLSEGCDTAWLLNHRGETLARTKSGTLKLSEVAFGNPTGLHTEARLDTRNPHVTAIRSAVDRGDLDEMSFAFRVTRQEWNEDYTRRWIIEVDLNGGDVSLVNYGANPATGGTVAIGALAQSAPRAGRSRLPVRNRNPLVVPNYGAEAKRRLAALQRAA